MKALLALFIACASACAEDSPVTRIDSIFVPLADIESPGFAVLVRRDGQTLAQRCYGIRDLRTKAPIDARTNFRLASVTKQFTAMAVMLLVNDRRLRYQDRLSDLLPGFPPYARKITVQHLLTHTSGLPDYEQEMEKAEKTKGQRWSAAHQISDEEVLALLQQAPEPKFKAGTSWDYSNSGYVLLGLIVAKRSGQPFGDFLSNRIFQPLKMADTLVYVNGKNTVRERAFGHVRRPGVFVEADQSSTSATLGDGGVYSNLDDLAKWDAALENHALLGARKMKIALTPVRLGRRKPTYWPAAPGDDNLNPGKPVSYGFGWFLDPYQVRTRMWHSGSTSGFRNAIQRFPSDRLTVIILSNRADLDITSLSLKVADEFLARH